MGLFSEGSKNLSGNRNDFLKGAGTAIVVLETAAETIAQKKKVPQTMINFKVAAMEPGSDVLLGKSYAFRYCKADDTYGSALGTLLSAVSGFGGVRVDSMEHTLEDLGIAEKYDLSKARDAANATIDADEAFEAMLKEMTSGEGEAWKGRIAQVTWKPNAKGTFTNVRFDPLPPGTAADGKLTDEGAAFIESMGWEIWASAK